MRYFDLHSDTLYEAYRHKISPLSGQDLTAPLARLPFENCRVLAIWSDNTLDDNEAYRNFFKILTHYQNASAREGQPEHCRAILAVEDARLLARDEKRLDTLYENGVRVLTLTWEGISCIGGAWNTEEGLTPFGKSAVQKALFLGMVIDLSHASDKSFLDAIALCEKHGIPPMASHSNSRALCPHGRNLTDGMFQKIAALGGIVGVSFVPYHLSPTQNATLDTVVSHILHFLSLGGEDTLAIGSDLDGVGSLPQGITGIESIESLAWALEKATSKQIAEKILWQNACRYFGRFSFH